MKNSQETLISELISRLDADDQIICREVIICLESLGYVPQRQSVQSFMLSFHNKAVRQTIAKLGVKSGGKAFYAVKFYAFKNPPPRFTGVVRDTVLKSNMQYQCSNCGICGAAEGERGYMFTYPDGTKFIRCGAYVVEIPELTPEDIDDFCTLLREQHAYFLLRTRAFSSSPSIIKNIYM